MTTAGFFMFLATHGAKATWLFRPASLNFDESDLEARVTDNVVIIRHTAKLDRGIWFWFPGADRVEVPVPAHLPLSCGIACRRATTEVKSTATGMLAVAADMAEFMYSGRRKWKNGESVPIEIAIPCDTESMLVFPEGKDPAPEIAGTSFAKTFVIAKNQHFSGVRITSYPWRRDLIGMLPLRSLIVEKNGMQEENVRVSVTRSTTATVATIDLSLDEAGTLVQHATPASRAESILIEIPLSFECNHDRYRIIFNYERP